MVVIEQQCLTFGCFQVMMMTPRSIPLGRLNKNPTLRCHRKIKTMSQHPVPAEHLSKLVLVFRCPFWMKTMKTS